MYPNLYYAFKDLFGLEIPFLKIINSFGFFVAVAYLTGAWLLAKEYKRKQAEGLFNYTEKKITVGEPASFNELLLNFLLGFVFGYKLLGIFFTPGALDDAQTFIFSWKGNWLTGIGLGAILAWMKWRDKNKVRMPKPEVRTIKVWPSDRIGDITILAAIFGFIGAKMFDNFENWDRFVEDPIGNIFSASGLTFYGGLIVAISAILVYLYKNRISIIHTLDAAAPSLMISYGLGRVGCQVSGDGDWGIVNTSPNPFSFLPDWFWAYDYPHNVNKEGIPIPGCTWDNYCTHLAQPVFPTPLYEIIMAFALFGLLWFLRKRIKMAGRLFAIYLIVNGIERFLIELIRVNTKMNLFGLHPTQAELISTLLVIAGIVLFFASPKIDKMVRRR